MYGRIFISQYFPFHYHTATTKEDSTIILEYGNESYECEISECTVQGSIVTLTTSDAIPKKLINDIDKHSIDFITLATDLRKNIAIAEKIQNRGANVLIFQIYQQRSIISKPHVTMTDISEKNHIDKLAVIQLISRQLTVLSDSKHLFEAELLTVINPIGMDPRFLKDSFKVIHVNEESGFITLKPPMANPMAAVQFRITRYSELRPEVLPRLFRQWLDCGANCVVWAGARGDKKSFSGFVDLVTDKMTPVGSRASKRRRGSGPLKMFKFEAEKPAFEEFTRQSIIKPEMHMSDFATVSLDNRSFLTSMVAYPQYLRAEDLPNFIGVFRQDNKFYNADELSEEIACGTFYFRMPNSEMYLPIDKSKTIVYNDKHVSVIDVLFKLEDEPRNTGVRRFWTCLPFLNIDAFNEADSEDFFDEFGYYEDEGKDYIDIVRKEGMPVMDERIKNRLIKVMSESRMSLVFDKSPTWWNCVKFVFENFISDVNSRIKHRLARLFYTQPPNLTMFVYWNRNRWCTQRTTSLPDRITKHWLKHPLHSSEYVMGVLTRPGRVFTSSEMESLRWVAETCSIKTPLIIETDSFDDIVRYDCMTYRVMMFMQRHSPVCIKIPPNVGKLTYFSNAFTRTSVDEIDMMACYILEYFNVENGIYTSSFMRGETAFTEILDVRPRDSYQHLIWTGPLAKRDTYKMEIEVDKLLKEFKLSEAIDLMSKHHIDVELQRRSITNMYWRMITSELTSEDDLKRIASLTFTDGSDVVFKCDPATELYDLMIGSRSYAGGSPNRKLAIKLLNLRNLEGGFLVDLASRRKFLQKIMEYSSRHDKYIQVADLSREMHKWPHISEFTEFAKAHKEGIENSDSYRFFFLHRKEIDTCVVQFFKCLDEFLAQHVTRDNIFCPSKDLFRHPDATCYHIYPDEFELRTKFGRLNMITEDEMVNINSKHDSDYPYRSAYAAKSVKDLKSKYEDWRKYSKSPPYFGKYVDGTKYTSIGIPNFSIFDERDQFTPLLIALIAGTKEVTLKFMPDLYGYYESSSLPGVSMLRDGDYIQLKMNLENCEVEYQVTINSS